jgi:hypothetical protein
VGRYQARMSDELHLCINDDGKRLSLVKVENAGHSDYFVATLVVMSRGFSCEHPLYFDRFHADDFIVALERMVSGEVKEGVLKQEHEEDHITFRNNHLGHVFIAGEVNEYGTGHRLTFVIDTDQTVLRSFIDDFREVIAR